jgi:transmembrane sensor
MLAFAFLVPGLGGTTLSSGVGERRTVKLDDGTRVTLNTATRLRVSFDRSQRRVLLQSGEARFDVARDEAWPFVVAVGEQEVRALGTSFTVRKIVDDIAITLIEGKVSIAPADPVTAGPAVSQAVVLAPGQRLTLSTDRPATLDRPDIERATAWQRGLISLDRTPLAEAVAEMNRYSGLPIEIGDGANEVRVSGIFQAGDSVEFARALARTHGLMIREEPERIVISGHAR